MTSMTQIEQKQKTTDFFDHYIRGGRVKWGEEFEKRRKVWRRSKVPKRKGGAGKWRGIYRQVFGLPREPINSRLDRWWSGDYVASRRGEVAEPTLKLAKQLQRHQLAFVKVLGWGGMGVAVLFKDSARPAGYRYYVAKCRFDGNNEELMCEKETMEQFAGAEHVVQVLDFTQLDKMCKDDESSKTKSAEDGDVHGSSKPALEAKTGAGNNDSTFLLEYHPRGTLDRFGKLIARRRKALSTPTLWYIFDCLFQMAVALRYPPRYWSDFDEKSSKEVYERIPCDEDVNSTWNGEHNKCFIHFDIDLSNILLGDVDVCNSTRPHHLVTPALKLNDFGLCSDIRQFSGHAPSMWMSRLNGKELWFTPEQFTTEWKHVRGLPPPKAKVAGKYSWKTNMWQLGQVMWCLITQCQPPEGSVPEEVELQDQGEDQNKSPKRWTYGNYICRDDNPLFNNVDMDLRRLVMRCMMDDPADRPEMAEIRAIIDGKLYKTWGPHDDSDLQADMQDCFRYVPIPQEHPQGRLNRWLRGEEALNIFSSVYSESSPEEGESGSGSELRELVWQ